MRKLRIVTIIMLSVIVSGCGNNSNHTSPNSQNNVSDILAQQTTEIETKNMDVLANIGTEDETTEKNTEKQDLSKTPGIDVDLTTLSSTMVYSEVYDMMGDPDKYVGKIIKMKGAFSYLQDDETKNEYFMCVIADATACCQQGIEFVDKDTSLKYPGDYPEAGTEITVVGEFQLYDEDGTTYCHLVDAKME